MEKNEKKDRSALTLVARAPQRATTNKQKKTPPSAKDVQELLLNLLSLGRLVITPQWNFLAKGWITSIRTADIDSDSDIEIVIGSRDGYVRALTRLGTLLWEEQVEKEGWVTTLATVPPRDREEKSADPESGDLEPAQFQEPVRSFPAIIVGTSSGKLYALDQRGKQLADWSYAIEADQVICQVVISPQRPDDIVIGAEDRCVHLLECATGKPLWKRLLRGRVYAICVADIDGDGELEILASTSDKRIVVLNWRGELKGTLSLEYRSAVLAVVEPSANGANGREVVQRTAKPVIVASPDGKRLAAWSIEAVPGKKEKIGSLKIKKSSDWQFAKETAFKKRPDVIHIADINNDERQEILVGSADYMLSIFDDCGHLLWRETFGQSIQSIGSGDYDDDGRMEVLLGLGDNSIRAIKINLAPSNNLVSPIPYGENQVSEAPPTLYQKIQEVGEELRRLSGANPVIPDETLAQLAQALGVIQAPAPKIEVNELSLARHKMNSRLYKEALAILVRLKEQGVQYYWSDWVTNLGYNRALSFGDIKGNPINELIVGSDEGEILALNIDAQQNKVLWHTLPESNASVLALQTGNPHEDGYEATLVVLDNGKLYLLNNEGDKQPLPETLVLEPEDSISTLAVTYEQIDGTRKIRTIILGLQNKKIYVYRGFFQECEAVIATDASVRAVSVWDTFDGGLPDIVATLANHSVCLYTRDSLQTQQAAWSYPIRHRIHALYVADIDGDQQPEILVGSEDCALSVLNAKGELKWRYMMSDSVLCIHGYDLDTDGKLEVLAGSADGYIYFLSSDGDRLRQLPVYNLERVQVVHVLDMHPRPFQDGYAEIAVATDTALMLFQWLYREEVDQMIQECWRRESTQPSNHRSSRERLYEYADYQREPNPYIRAFALKRLAGQRSHQPLDFVILQNAVNADPSPVVWQALADALINLSLSSSTREHFRMTRQLLERLAQKPHQETRQAIVRMLGMLKEIVEANPDLDVTYLEAMSFEYLERFLGNTDLWLKQYVVHQLYKLADAYPEQVFRLLALSAQDPELWIQQETGRGLARCFDAHPELLFQHLPQLLSEAIPLSLIQQVAISSEVPVIKQLFRGLLSFLQQIRPEAHGVTLTMLLDESQKYEAFKSFKAACQQSLKAFVSVLEQVMQSMPLAEDIYVIYQQIDALLQVKNASDIEQFRRSISSEELAAFSPFHYLDELLQQLLSIAKEVKQYHKRKAFGDKAATLIETTYLLSRVRNQFASERLRLKKGTPEPFLLPEDVLICLALQEWHVVLRKELRRLRGKADLQIELLSQDTPHEDIIELFFQLTNRGRTAAEDISVSLAPDSAYACVGPAERHIEEISMNGQTTISFLVQPGVDNFRIETQLHYSDADGPAFPRSEGFQVQLQRVQQVYQEIPNPYHGGTPISEESMFYGRQDDMDALQVILGNATSQANRVVVLIGQRRSGKTSLLNQLAKRLAQHLTIQIDLQRMALSNTTAELFSCIASSIGTALESKGSSLTLPGESDFAETPTETFDRYLERVTEQLAGTRLILLIDEFEVFNQLIRSQKLAANFPYYLRSVMQHHPGINFLLAGAPHILQDELNIRPALFNIAQQQHLARLSDEDARKLIREPVAQYLTYDPLALARIHQLTSGQPYLIHLLSEVLIQHCNRRQKNYANTNDVSMVLETVLERGQNYFMLMWRLAATPVERLLFSYMAQETDEGFGMIFSLTDMQEALLDVGLSYEHEKLWLALQHLKQEELIEEQDREGRLYAIPLGLMRAWISIYKPFTRVIDEEVRAGGQP